MSLHLVVLLFLASELQTTMMETMEAVELEKQKHNDTRMEALARLSKLESVNAELARFDRIAELRLQIHMKEASHEVKTLETSIETTRRELEDPTEVEIELKRRLSQLTDHLIQKQAQGVSRLLDENRSIIDSADFPGTSSTNNPESGVWQLSNSKLRPLWKERMQSGQQHFRSLVRQLDSIFWTGAVFLRRIRQLGLGLLSTWYAFIFG
ncbi:UNVERIFIED_CONTAM: Golgin candidate 2 [Sesamum calycinum]|uniref:Golgin candidate 2 n=1 Tax=Sesamum calycinum TaxID=2727403 RepID=A0AAW2JW52_9LAMI